MASQDAKNLVEFQPVGITEHTEEQQTRIYYELLKPLNKNARRLINKVESGFLFSHSIRMADGVCNQQLIARRNCAVNLHYNNAISTAGRELFKCLGKLNLE